MNDRFLCFAPISSHSRYLLCASCLLSRFFSGLVLLHSSFSAAAFARLAGMQDGERNVFQETLSSCGKYSIHFSGLHTCSEKKCTVTLWLCQNSDNTPGRATRLLVWCSRKKRMERGVLTNELSSLRSHKHQETSEENQTWIHNLLLLAVSMSFQ